MKSQKSYHIQMIVKHFDKPLTSTRWEVRDNNDICYGRYRKIEDARIKLRYLNDQLELDYSTR